MSQPKVYSTDHSESVLSTHRWRTLQNSAAYLLPHLTPGLEILDAGCGPGSITVDLAKHTPGGEVIGLELEPAPLAEARKLAEHEGITNVDFRTGDVHNLPFEDETFDIVHSHQVLQHVADPVKALSEMRRITKAGGIVAARCATAMSWYPPSPGIALADRLHNRIAKDRGGNPNSGHHLHAWAHRAGFTMEQITRSTGSWCFSTPEERQYWGGTQANRTESSGFTKIAIEGGYATAEELAEIARGWRAWVEDEEGWFGYMHAEILCRK